MGLGAVVSESVNLDKIRIFKNIESLGHIIIMPL